MNDGTPTRRVNHDDGETVRGLAAGRKYFGRYTLEALAGRGGMGVVWRARDEELGESVALKLLPEVVARDTVAVDELKEETRRARRLRHPNIVSVFDFVRDGAMAAVSMEFVDGATLAHLRLEQPGKIFAPETLAPLVTQLCAALDYAHADAKVVHRDLKPANLLVSRDGKLKVADFGIARSLTETHTRLTGTMGGTSGTLLYMSPQQLMGKKTTPTDDIYALGATLYELLTGKPPFFTGDITHQVLNLPPAPLAAQRVELGMTGTPIPPAWEETILACLAKDPAQRPPSAGEVAQRLHLWRPGSVAQMPAASPLPHAPVVPEKNDRPSAVRYISSVEDNPAPENVPAWAQQYPLVGTKRRRSWSGWNYFLLVAVIATIVAYILGYTPLRRPWVPEGPKPILTVAAETSSSVTAQPPDAGAVATRERNDHDAIRARVAAAHSSESDAADQAFQTYLASAPEQFRDDVPEVWRKTREDWATARAADEESNRQKAEARRYAELQVALQLQTERPQKPEGAAPPAAASTPSASKDGAFSIAEVDQVPQPRVQTRPLYPFEMRRAGISGEVVVDFVVDMNGEVQSAYAFSSTRREFEAAAVQAVNQWKFIPARKAGRPVNVHLQVPITFTLNND